MPKTLLLADDSVTIQRVIELTFAHEDVRVVSVGDGRRAMQWMETDWPDIVLVDVEVPEVDGYAVATHMKQSARLKNVPVLLLAGAFEPVDQERVQRIGFDGVLVKPFEPQLLVNRVKALLAASASAANGGDPAERSHETEPATVTAFPGMARSMSATSPMEHGAEPEALEPPVRPVWESAPAPAPVEKLEPPTVSRVSLVNAFSALLAAEQSNPATSASVAAATPLSDASVEEAVRRVLVRMTDDLVRRIVLDTAERLIREEIEKIKTTPE